MKKSYIIHFVAGVVISLSAGAQTAVWKTKVDPVVLKKAETASTIEFVAVLKERPDLSAADKLETKEEKGLFVYNALKAAAQHSQGEITELLSKSNVPYQSYFVTNIVYVPAADVKMLEAVASLASVESVIENTKYVVSKTIKDYSVAPAETQSPNATSWGITKVKADQVWALGFKGQGVVVSGEDTGYDWKHVAIKSKYRGDGATPNHNYNWHDAVHSGGGSCGPNKQEPCDDQEHGTHTMGTICGGDASNPIGMAPDAKWIGCRNMNDGNGTLTSYVECFQFFLAPTDLGDKNADPSKSPHVINNSWGCPTSEGCNSSNFATMETVVNNLRAAGVVVVVSAGNDGATCSILNTPAAIFTGRFTVGSTTNTDAISSFSSRGPVTNSGPTRVSPDISAPGSNITSCVPGGSYSSLSGTSMAGPHVAGLVALVISANPALAGKVQLIEDIIQSTAVKLYSSACGSGANEIPNNTFGYGRIDALAAVKKATDMVWVKEHDKSGASVVAYPNPFNNKINFEFGNWNPGTTLEVYSITGTIVISKTWESMPSKYEVDLSNQASGAYFYRVSNGTESANGKLFKVDE
jgi:subtilisin family serine protease